MQKIILFTLSIVILFTCRLHSFASRVDSIPQKPFISTINLYKGKTLRGYITGITDSAVFFVHKADWSGLMYDSLTVIPVKNIRSISNKKISSISKAAGAAIGFAIGIGLGYAVGNKIANEGNRYRDESFFQWKYQRVPLVTGSVAGATGLVWGIIGNGKKKRKKVKIRGNPLMLKYKSFDILSP